MNYMIKSYNRDKISQSNFIKNYVMLLALLILMVIGTVLSNKFIESDNIINILRQSSIIGIVSLGVTFVIISGTFDLSVGSTVILTGILAISLQPYLGVFWTVIIVIGVGLLIGLINGVIVAAVKADAGDSFMLTFGMLSFLQAIALIISKGHILPGSKSAAYNFLGDGMIGFIPMPVIIFIVLTVLLYFFLTYTKPGRSIYYMGANVNVARLSGIRIVFFRVFVYVISGLLATLAALVLTARIKSATGTMGIGYEMDAVTAIVIGGVSLDGGKGTILNAVIGVFIIGVLSNVLSMIGVSTQNQMVAKGIIIIIAVCVEKLRR